MSPFHDIYMAISCTNIVPKEYKLFSISTCIFKVFLSTRDGGGDTFTIGDHLITDISKVRVFEPMNAKCPTPRKERKSIRSSSDIRGSCCLTLWFLLYVAALDNKAPTGNLGYITTRVPCVASLEYSTCHFKSFCVSDSVTCILCQLS